MGILVKDAGAWKDSEPYVRDAGIWKPVDTGYVKDAGVWKEMYSSGPRPVVDAGIPFGGGYYAGGNIIVDGIEYALVVAPKALGETTTPLRWRNTNAATVGSSSLNDGFANTQARPGQASAFCADLTIAGYNDWYLPALDELEIIYRHLKPSTANNATGSAPPGLGRSNGLNPHSIPVGPAYTSSDPNQTAVELFRVGGAEAMRTATYWTSTQSYASNLTAYAINFSNGNQGHYNKDSTTIYSRAVRRVRVS